MSPKRTHRETDQSLRQRAEQILARRPQEHPTLPTVEIQKLLHELDVHREELELQNEELRRTQAELAVSRDHLANLYDFAPVGYLTLDGHDKILQANLTAAKLLGVERNTLSVGFRFVQFVTHDLRDEWHRFRLRAFETEQPQSCELSLAPRGGADPLFVRLECCVAPDAWPPDSCRNIALVDITQSRVAEAALRDSEQHFRTLAAHAPDVIARVDRQLRYLYVNPAVERLFGLHPQMFLGKTQHELGWPNDVVGLWTRQQQAAFDRGQEQEFDYDHPAPTRYRSLHVTLVPEPAIDGASTSLLVLVRDVTGQKQAEAERRRLDARLQDAQKLESLSVLAGGVAHDFNNLLAIILGNAELIAHDLPAGSRMAEFTTTMMCAAQRAAELCQQMLAYSGRGHFLIAPHDLSGLVREMSELVATSIPKRIVVSYTLASDLPPVLADATQMGQVVMNLVLNAVEAIGDRDGRITIRTAATSLAAQATAKLAVGGDLAPGEYVLLEVTDTGSGMDAATLRRVFEPFFTSKRAGRGLGLAAVQGIVRGHRGAVVCASDLGQGSVFSVYLPTTRAIPQGSPAPRRVTPPPQDKPPLVLFVDDESALRSIGESMLTAGGYGVLTAEDGTDAVELFTARGAEISCVVLDLTMKRMNGLETLRKLREMRPGVPAILMSGYSEFELSERFAGEGLADFMQKPFTWDTLLRKVSDALGRS